MSSGRLLYPVTGRFVCLPDYADLVQNGMRA